MPRYDRRTVVSALATLSAGCLGAPTDRRGASTGTDTATDARSSATGTAGPPTETSSTTAAGPPTLDAVDGSWPMPAFDAGRTRYDPDGTVPDGPTSAAWTAPVAERPHQVVVGDGRVFVGDRGGVAAFDAVTGDRLWVRSFEGDRVAGPVLGDALYVGVGDEVRALGPADGAVRWRTGTGAGQPNYLVPADGTVYAGTEGGGTDGPPPAVVALDADGVVWAATPDDWPVARFAEVAVAGGTVYTIAWSGGSATAHVALDRASGDRRWQVTTISHATALTVADGTLLAGGFYGQIEARAAADGGKLWAHSGPGAVATTGLAGETVLATDHEQAEPTTHAFDRSGNERWHASPGGTMLAAGSGLAVLDDDGVSVVGLADGTVRWSQPTEGWAPEAGALADGVLFVTGDDGTVRALA